ncbi:MAG: response regulator [Pseudomonadota bacterium]
MRMEEKRLINAPPAPEKAMKVLLAEDDQGMRKLVALILQRSGFDVIEAADGNALQEKIEQLLLGGGSDCGVDIIVTDIYMPGPNALETLAMLRKAGVDTPVVMITAFGDYELHEEANRLGAEAVFDKPFALQELSGVLSVIRDRLNARSAGRTNDGADDGREKGKRKHAVK